LATAENSSIRAGRNIDDRVTPALVLIGAARADEKSARQLAIRKDAAPFSGTEIGIARDS
jgi:hypothetical protein